MATYKIINPEVVGKIKLPSEIINKALTIDASGQITSSTTSATELGYLTGVTSAVQTQIDSKASSSDLSTHIADTANPHAVTKAQVGLANVDNTSDATKNSATATLTNKTIDAASNTISNISNSNIAAAAAIAESKLALDYSTSSLNTAIGTKISSSEKGANNGVATLDSGGKVPASQLPNTVMELKSFWNAATNTPTLTDGVGNPGDIYEVDTAGTVDFGNGNITFAVGDWAVYAADGKYHKSVNSNAVTSVNGQTGTVTLTKSDVGLGNVDNTSDATKNSATATLTNKTISATNNTISDLSVSNLGAGVLDTDLSAVSALDDTIPSAKAVKSYVDSNIGASSVVGDIALTTFNAANNQATPANVTGLSFSTANVRGFKALVTVTIDATSDLFEVFELIGVQKAAGFDMAISGTGDNSGVSFSITSAGQVQYTSSNVTGFVTNKIAFRAQCTNI